MDYKEIRDLVEKMGNENYRDLIKALVSYEKGINDMDALDEMYEEFMDSDTKGLLHEDFDYMIDDLRVQGKINETIEYVSSNTFNADNTLKSEDKDLKELVGNIARDVELVTIKNNQGENVKAANFTIISNDDNGEKSYTSCSAYGEKSNIPKDFKKGDFVKVHGQLRVNEDKDGKQHSYLRVISSKLLKAKEHIKENKKSVLGAIKKFKEEEKEAKIDKSEKGVKDNIER